jgi:molybdate transport system permease protein
MRLMLFAQIAIIFLSLFFGIVIIFGFYSVNFSEFAVLLKDDEFLKSVVFTLKTSIAATFIAFITGVPAGFYLARKKTFISNIIDVLFDIPIVIPPLIVGVFLMNLFNNEFVKGFYDFIFTLQGAAVAQFFIAFPFTVKASKNAFGLVSPIYERIAMTLGATSFRSFFDTTFKIAFPGILSGVILTWLRCVGEFGATLMVGGGIAGKTENLPVYIYINMVSGDFEKAVAASVFTVVIGILCIVVLKLFFNQSKRKRG